MNDALRLPVRLAALVLATSALTGPALATTYLVNAANGGTLTSGSTLAFTGIATLHGGAGNDTF